MVTSDLDQQEVLSDRGGGVGRWSGERTGDKKIVKLGPGELA